MACKQRAYLSLTRKPNVPMDMELHNRRIEKRIRDRFTRANESSIIQDCNLTDIRPSDFAQHPGPSYIITPSFASKTYHLALDAIKILPVSSGATKLLCIPIKASSNVVVSKNERLELCMIAILLQKHAPIFQNTHCTIISEWNPESTTFSQATHIQEARRYLRQLTAMNDLPVQPRYYKIDHCKTCPNKNYCEKELIIKDDLSLLGSMSPTQIGKLNSRGILTVNQLSYTFRCPKNPKLTRPNFALKALAVREMKTYVLEPPIIPVHATEIFVDFEGFPDERCIYLIGMIVRDKQREFSKSFWAESLSDTDAVLTSFLAELRGIGDFVMYHYGSFEVRALKRFGRGENNALSVEIDSILAKSVNLLTMLSQNVYPPTYSNGLKDVAGFLKFDWSTPTVSGQESIVLRQKWELDRSDSDKDILVRYNLDDCMALRITKDWLVDVAKQAKDGNTELGKASEVKATSYHKWGKTRFDVNDFDVINQRAYFDYQRSKVYLRTSKVIKTALLRERKARAGINAIDRRIRVPEQCPHCGGNQILSASKIMRPRRVLDLRFMKNGIKKWVVEVIGKDFRCNACDNVFSVSMYGRNLTLWSMNQHITYRIGMVKVGQMLLENYNINVPLYKLSYLKGDLAKEYQETANRILQSMVRGPLIHIDESAAFVRDCPSAYVWVFASMDSVYYMLRPTREAAFLHETLSGFDGVLISDFYSGYDSLPCKKQKCLVHLIRDLNGDFRKNQFNIELKSIVNRFGALLRSIVDTIDKYGLRQRHLQKHMKDVEAFYQTMVETQYETEIAAHYQKRLTRNREKLFEFLKHDEIPWNNNNVENAIKPFAKYREMAGPLGTRKGLEDYLVLLSIQQTCKYRGIGFLDFLKSGKKNLEEYTDCHFQRKRRSVTQTSQEQATPDIAFSQVTELPYAETQANLIGEKPAKERIIRRKHIPLFPEIITEITTNLTFSNIEGRVTYYQNEQPVFTHKEDDKASFKMIISQFCVNRIVKQAQIAKAFGISLRVVKLAVKKYREYGPPGFYARKKLRGAGVLTEPVMIEAQRLLDKGFAVKMVAERLGLKYDTVRKAARAGRLHILRYEKF